MWILSGIMDQGSNVKTHIYGDGYYQSPAWRYSSAAYLRANFVPKLDSNGVQIGMTSTVDAFNHSLLKDRPADEAEQCLADDYLMPFSRYQARIVCIRCDARRRGRCLRALKGRPALCHLLMQRIITRGMKFLLLSCYRSSAMTRCVCVCVCVCVKYRSSATTPPSPCSGASSPPTAPTLTP
jgi:hypothetical protein